MNDRSWIVNDCSQTAACTRHILLHGILQQSPDFLIGLRPLNQIRFIPAFK